MGPERARLCQINPKERDRHQVTLPVVYKKIKQGKRNFSMRTNPCSRILALRPPKWRQLAERTWQMWWSDICTLVVSMVWWCYIAKSYKKCYYGKKQCCTYLSSSNSKRCIDKCKGRVLMRNFDYLFIFYFWSISKSPQGLLLVLFSAVTPGRAKGTI